MGDEWGENPFQRDWSVSPKTIKTTSIGNSASRTKNHSKPKPASGERLRSRNYG